MPNRVKMKYIVSRILVFMTPGEGNFPTLYLHKRKGGKKKSQ